MSMENKFCPPDYLIAILNFGLIDPKLANGPNEYFLWLINPQ